jgi:hypothetical protein
MPDIFSVLVANGATWGVTLTLIIALLIVAVVGLYRDNRRQDSEIENLKVELESVKEKVDDKVSAIYDRLNAIASDVAFIKGRMEGEK